MNVVTVMTYKDSIFCLVLVKTVTLKTRLREFAINVVIFVNFVFIDKTNVLLVRGTEYLTIKTLLNVFVLRLLELGIIFLREFLLVVLVIQLLLMLPLVKICKL